MKKVLLIANYLESKGGISIQVNTMIEKINEGRNNADLFNTKKSSLARVFLPVQLLLMGFKYDVFYVHGCSFSGFYPVVIGAIVGKVLKKKIIITYHGGGIKEFMELYPKLTKRIFSFANQITVPSPYLLEVLKENKVKATLLPNIIKEDNVSFKKRDEFSPILISTRSLEPVYNIFFAIKAFEKIQKKYSSARLIIVGTGSLSEELKNYVVNSNLKNVDFLGAVDNTDIGKILNKADIYINPTYADNMPLSLFEAFACGLPVISTNVGGISNFIENDLNGFLIEPDDVEGLIEKIEFILANPKKVNKVIVEGSKTFQKFTWGQLKEEYNKLF